MRKFLKIMIILISIIFLILSYFYEKQKEKVVNTEKTEEKILNELWIEGQTLKNNITIPPKVENSIIKENTITKSKEKNSPSVIYPKYSNFSYATSELGRDLTCHSFTPNNYSKTILLVFAIHGYEDAYDKDGEVLVNTANKLIDYYQKASEDILNNTRILIVPCANPDGLYTGNTNNGFGRCNAMGIDLNRDFSANHKVFTNDRNKTLAPFSAKESKALRDLVEKYNPKCVLDLHGWLNYTIGDGKLANIIKEEMGLNHKTEFNDNCNGYFSYWAHKKGAYALLVEFKDTNISTRKLEKAVNRITKEIK